MNSLLIKNKRKKKAMNLHKQLDKKRIFVTRVIAGEHLLICHNVTYTGRYRSELKHQ